MQKAHSNIDWKNFPNLDTPVNEQNLNKMDVAIDTIDDRVIYLNTSKLDKTDAQELVKKIVFDRATGIFTITYFSGATTTIDTMLEKLAVNFTFDPETQILSIILDDGSTIPVDLSALITQYEFLESDTIAFQVDQSGKVSAIVKNGSITEEHLRPDYLADIRVESAKAENARQAAEKARDDSEDYADLSERWAKQANNYAEQAKESADEAKEIITDNFVLKSEKGKPNGVATLGSDGKVPTEQLPDIAGTVTSVNGKTGVVELTAEDVGAVAAEGDTAENTIAFTSNDTIDADATSWTVVSKLESGIKHSTFAQRISQMFKNVRYLYKMLGTTDISKFGDGTVTGALDALNSNLTWKYAGHTTGANPFKIIPEANEYLVVIVIDNNIYYATSIYFPASIINLVPLNLWCGASRGGKSLSDANITEGILTRITINNNEFHIHYTWRSGIDFTSTSVLHVYWR